MRPTDVSGAQIVRCPCRKHRVLLGTALLAARMARALSGGVSRGGGVSVTPGAACDGVLAGTIHRHTGRYGQLRGLTTSPIGELHTQSLCLMYPLPFTVPSSPNFEYSADYMQAFSFSLCGTLTQQDQHHTQSTACNAHHATATRAHYPSHSPSGSRSMSSSSTASLRELKTKSPSTGPSM